MRSRLTENGTNDTTFGVTALDKKQQAHKNKAEALNFKTN